MNKEVSTNGLRLPILSLHSKYMMPMWRPSPDWLQMFARMFVGGLSYRLDVITAMLWRTVGTLSTREDTETKQRFTVEEGSQWSQAISVSNCRRFRSRAGILQRRRAIDADDVQCQLLFIFSGCACQVPISTLWSLPHQYYNLCIRAEVGWTRPGPGLTLRGSSWGWGCQGPTRQRWKRGPRIKCFREWRAGVCWQNPTTIS